LRILARETVLQAGQPRPRRSDRSDIGPFARNAGADDIRQHIALGRAALQPATLRRTRLRRAAARSKGLSSLSVTSPPSA
jgi:hypothetical protein